MTTRRLIAGPLDRARADPGIARRQAILRVSDALALSITIAQRWQADIPPRWFYEQAR
jgi:hypothetical protein